MQYIPCHYIISKMLWLRSKDHEGDKIQGDVCKCVTMQESARYAPNSAAPETVFAQH
jgi:hypothetical protein